jgi:hypothetical protein
MALDPQLSKKDDEHPLTVKQAAKYLGVSPQTVSFGSSESRFPISA